MPHAPGRPSFEFPRPWQMASQAIPGFMSPEQYGQIGRGLLDFVPVVGTALNWNEMGPWGRTASVAMDVADVATLGSGKAVTFPIKTASKAIQKFMMRNDPKLAYVRGGFLPTIPHVSAPKGVQGRTADWQPDPYKELMFAAGQGDQFPIYPSFNYAAGAFEPGISTYQALKYSKGMDDPQWVIRNMPDEFVTREYPNRFNPVTGKPMTYNINPRVTQRHIMQDVMAGDVPMFENSGMRILASEGADTEALIDAAARVKTSTRLDPADIWHGNIGDEGFAQKQFAKYDQFGNLIPYDIEKWADQAWLASTLPATVPARGLDFTWDTPGQFGGAETEPPIQRAEGEGKILSLGALP